jgi:Clp amino terminal domain, pathogenicity island component
MKGNRMPTIDELAAVVDARARERHSAARLRAAIDLGRELTELGDALIGRFVAEARASGQSWTEIGQVFGTSKQAVQQRYGARSGELERWPERWTPDANDALDRAGQEARDLGHDYIGTEHALLALASAECGIASAVLRELGVTRERMLATRCMRADATERSPQECLSVMPRLKQALEHGRRIADGLDARLADTEHLLAGIVAVTDSMAVEILRRLGVKVGDVRAAIAERLDVRPERLGAARRRRRRLRAVAR